MSQFVCCGLSDYSAFDEQARLLDFALFFFADFAIVHLLSSIVFLSNYKYSV